jgi:integrase
MVDPQQNETPPLWTVADVCRFLGFGKTWVYDRVADGTLPHLNIGGRLRFKPDAVEAWPNARPNSQRSSRSPGRRTAMASVYRDKRNRVWIARLKKPHGGWTTRSTGLKGRKSDAQRRAAELQDELNKAAGAPSATIATVGEALTLYVDHLHGRPSHYDVNATVNKHLRPAFDDIELGSLTPAMVERFLDDKLSQLKPQTVNHLRAYLKRAIDRARLEGNWLGGNAVERTRTKQVLFDAHDHLRLQEIDPLLRALDEEHRPFFAVAIFQGLRLGELVALRRSDVDLASTPPVLTVRRSHGRGTTKSGKARSIPITRPARPWLEAALARSPSDLVFPDASGAQRRRGWRPGQILKRALRKAELVTGWDHKCRKRGCGHVERAPDKVQRRCPHDGRKLWPSAIARPIRFHDLRHTCATLLSQKGAPVLAVARFLGHQDVRTTLERYTHTDATYLAEQLGGFSAAYEQVADEALLLTTGTDDAFAYHLPTDGDEQASGAAAQRKTPGKTRGFVGAGDRVRTGDIQLGKLTLYQLSYARAEVDLMTLPRRCQCT